MNLRFIPLGLFVALCASVSAQDATPVFIFTTIAGKAGVKGDADGPASDARFNSPVALALDRSGIIYVADRDNATIRKISRDGVVTTLAGKSGEYGRIDGPGADARFGGTTGYNISLGSSSGTVLRRFTNTEGPTGVAVGPDDNIYVADAGNALIRKISPDGVVTTYAGDTPGNNDGIAAAAQFVRPSALAFGADGKCYVADSFWGTIRRIDANAAVTTLGGAFGAYADTGVGISFSYAPSGITIAKSGNAYVTDPAGGRLMTLGTGGSYTLLANVPFLYSVFIQSLRPGPPSGIAAHSDGTLYVAGLGDHTIRRVDTSGGYTTVGGTVSQAGDKDGMGGAAMFSAPRGIAIGQDGSLYIADTGNQTIRKGVRVNPPEITTQPQSQWAVAGQKLTLTVVASSPLVTATYQWTRNGTAITGATNATLAFDNFQPADANSYAVIVTNAAGSVTSGAAVVSIGALPTISSAPTAQSVSAGQNVVLSVVAAGTPAPTFQWRKDGVVIAGATSATLTLTGAQAGDAGSYAVVVTNAVGSVTSSAAVVTVNASRIVNLSIRSNLAAGGTLTVGFVVAGNGKSLLVRSVGPGLAQFGLSGTLADPRLGFYSGSTFVTSNDNWGSATNAAQIAAAAAQVGAFALPAGSLDAALLMTLDGGGYSAQIAGTGSAGGIMLVELYDANNTAAARLANVSARAQVGTGENALFAGFVISGNAKRTVLIRAIGPTLAAFGVPGVLVDPRLDLVAAGASAPLASNDDWGGSASIAAAFGSVGAFPLSATSKDAALLATLDPGSYSVQVSGVGGTTGEALVEIYEVP